MEFVDPNDIWKFRDIILSKISIVEIAKEYGLHLENKETGTFTHRTYCPLHTGKGREGQERTPSMFFSSHSDSFCCFGCLAGGSTLDFVSLMDGTPPPVALTKLAKKVGLVDKDGNWDELQLESVDRRIVHFDPLKTVDPYVSKISDILRGYIHRFIGTEYFEKELKWMERVGAKVDLFLTNIGFEDWEYAKELSEKVEKAVKRRLRSKD